MWFARAGGRWARAQERRLLRQNLRPIVGDFGAQLGDTQAPHLAYANLRRRFYIDANGGNARADWSALPFADDRLGCCGFAAHARDVRRRARRFARGGAGAAPRRAINYRRPLTR